MDAESLAQIEHIVTTAVTGTEERLRKEHTTAVRGTEGRLRNDMQAASASLTQEINERLNEKFEEAGRHSGALFEEALHRIDLVVEGHHRLFSRRSSASKREWRMDLRRWSTNSLRSAPTSGFPTRQLEERVETLEQRVTLIEKRVGLAN